MKTEVISYIENGHPASGKEAANQILDCKFVMIACSDCLHFVVGPVAAYRYHANLVQRFCEERSLASAWVQRPDVLEVVDPDARVLGGGHLLIDEPTRRMKLYGVSRAYGVFNARDLSGLAEKEPFFLGYRVSFGRG
jgi:hypothetical protein